MKSLGVLVKNPGLGQPEMLIVDSLNKMVSVYTDVEPILFFRDYGPQPLRMNFALMQNLEAWSFDGTLISTDLETTRIMLACIRSPKKFFYVWDLEWVYQDKFNFKEMSSIYNNDELELIARSPSHAKVIENCWKKPIALIDDFNYEKIKELA